MRKILRCFVLADIHSPDMFVLGELKPQAFDVVLTLGDIPPEIIDYVLHMAGKVPVYGVLGNHDPSEIPGLEALQGRTVTVQGIRIGGFGGARKYKDHPNHYTEKEVAKELRKMLPVDVFISHAPPLATSRQEDAVHQGFESFDRYIQEKSPRYWLHGHLERNYVQEVSRTFVVGIQGKKPLTLEFGL